MTMNPEHVPTEEELALAAMVAKAKADTLRELADGFARVHTRGVSFTFPEIIGIIRETADRYEAQYG
ncbi:hypothetical protein LWF01_02890 [Saxibacter everestensis]|uniref:Uncharacterized protein n=1 Tax=Saxibacter everestensis TaxID=2909229 RepID=A0ABY8QUR0_9MICO|nr:hypothetical protein LWF01_02890 [Brevibacteriaceae bacterium ZFBP1038]